jgi:hypothetical protein
VTDRLAVRQIDFMLVRWNGISNLGIGSEYRLTSSFAFPVTKVMIGTHPYLACALRGGSTTSKDDTRTDCSKSAIPGSGTTKS